MSNQIDLGVVLSVPKGDWNANTTYERLNIVRHNSASWICNVATSKGVEPREGVADWYLQVKDTSAVSSINGMTGDVIIDSLEESPSSSENSTKIATTAWVNNKLDNSSNSLKAYTDSAITQAELDIKNDIGESVDSKIETAVSAFNGKFDDYIPTTGGALTGDIYGQDNAKFLMKGTNISCSTAPTQSQYFTPFIIRESNGKDYFFIQAVKWANNNANLVRFVLANQDGSQGPILTIQQSADGTSRLLFDGIDVLTSAGGTVGRLSTNVETALVGATDTGTIQVWGGTVAGGSSCGRLILYSKNNSSYPSECRLQANENILRVPATTKGLGYLGGSEIITAAKAASALTNVAIANYSTFQGCTKVTSGSAIYAKLPTGGTWRYLRISGSSTAIAEVAGGSQLQVYSPGSGSGDGAAGPYYYSYIAVRYK